MNTNTFFLHSFKRGNTIEGEAYRMKILKRLQLILTYSLVSSDYYDKYIKDRASETYEQNWSSDIYGYSRDYISILDPYIACKNPQNEIKTFIRYPNAYVILKRDWIKKKLIESRKILMNSPEIDVHKKLLKGNNELGAIERSFINPYFNQYNDLREVEYVLPGEIKVKDKIPLEEICGLAFGEHILSDKANIDMINQVLDITNMHNLPVYLIKNTDSWGAGNLTFKKVM